MKFSVTDYTNKTEILKFPDHYVAIAVMVDDTNVSANADGKKIVPAGTPVGGVGGSVIDDESLQVEKKNTQDGTTGTTGAGVDAEGILLNDVDVTHGPAPGAMLIHGFVDGSKLPEAICADAKAAIEPMVKIID